MRKTSFWKSATRRSTLTLTITALVAIVALIYFLPRESKFGYTYEQGKPWRYPQLIASYDFPIYRSDADVKRDRDSIEKHFMPYYAVDTAVASKHIALLRSDFYAGKLGSVPAYYLPHLVEYLDEAYHKGILSAQDFEALNAEGGGSVRIVEGTQASLQQVSHFFTPKTAYDFIVRRGHLSIPPDVLRDCDLSPYLAANIRADEEKNKQEKEAALAAVSTTSGMVQSGQLIIDRGQIVNPERYNILSSLRKESEKRMDPSRGYWMVFAGQALCVVILIGLLILYLRIYRQRFYKTPRYIILLFSLVCLFPILTYLMMEHHFYSVYLIPYALTPIFARIFLDSRTAFMSFLVSALLSALALHSPFEFLLQQTVAGCVVVYTLRELTERSQLLRTVALAVASALVVSVAYDLSQGLAWEAFDRSRAIYTVIGGVLLLFAYPLMYILEKLFGFTTSVTLVELSNANTPLFRRMTKVAQGTFNHSMQVANLAAEVANKIGAETQLARTGALYHDIGKIENPAFFTENQTGVNPHDTLSEEDSAKIIINHVHEGLRLADEFHLPKIIREFISTHHGTGLAKYFYIQYCNKHPGETVDKAPFSYPGPNPHTREQAIVMMCDSVEAASRSLKEYTEETISSLVEKIVDAQVAEGFFKECPLTFRDIADAKRTLVDSLKTIYHTRITYPDMNPSGAAASGAASDAEEASGRASGLWKL